MLKIMRDLTTVREGEAARRRAEDRFALIVQTIKDYAIYMLDPEGRVNTWNKAAERVKGFTEEEIIGTHFSFCFTPEDIAAGRPEHEKNIAIETGECHVESWRIRKGAHYWGEKRFEDASKGNGQTGCQTPPVIWILLLSNFGAVWNAPSTASGTVFSINLNATGTPGVKTIWSASLRSA